jgi:hypothetical protein
MNYFANDAPSFVSVKGDHFVIDGKQTATLRGMIQKIQPVRKHFRNGELTCYSMDGRISTHGKYCLFCDEKYRCQKKLRVSMLDITQPEFQPIILDINQASFESLETFIKKTGEEQLHCTPVTLKIIYDDNDRRSIEFME